MNILVKKFGENFGQNVGQNFGQTIWSKNLGKMVVKICSNDFLVLNVRLFLILGFLTNLMFTSDVFLLTRNVLRFFLEIVRYGPFFQSIICSRM